MNIRYISLLCVAFSSFLFPCDTSTVQQNSYSNRVKSRSIVLDTLYGSFTITEPVLCDLLACPTVNRLRGINQYGIDAYVNDFPEYTRYQHSIGVMCLLRRFEASLQEQIAGLLHDVSHTVFSHVGDHLFGMTQKDNSMKDSKDSYQDSIHAWFIKNSEIVDILAHYGYTVDDIIHKNGMFLMLEQDAPDLCADRIEYNLYGGLIENRISRDDIDTIVNALRYSDGHWYFVDVQLARKIADVSLFLTEHHFGASWNGIINMWAAQLLQRALELNIISIDDIHFSVDDVVWNKINASSDASLLFLLQKLHNYKQHYKDVSNDDHYDYVIYPKFRGLNPLVNGDDGLLSRLCDGDRTYQAEFERVKNVLKNGRRIQLID